MLESPVQIRIPENIVRPPRTEIVLLDPLVSIKEMSDLDIPKYSKLGWPDKTTGGAGLQATNAKTTTAHKPLVSRLTLLTSRVPITVVFNLHHHNGYG